jgi:hypothetical protein
MMPSSRTPEGEDNFCPVCGHAVRIEPSRPPGDAPCPDCGSFLWFPAIEDLSDPKSRITEDVIDVPQRELARRRRGRRKRNRV